MSLPVYFTGKEIGHRKVGHLPQVKQLVSSRARVWTPGLLATHFPRAASHCEVTREACKNPVEGEGQGEVTCHLNQAKSPAIALVT